MHISDAVYGSLLGVLAIYGARQITDRIAWPIYQRVAPHEPTKLRKFCELTADIVGDIAAGAVAMTLVPKNTLADYEGYYKAGVLAVTAILSANESARSLHLLKQLGGFTLGASAGFILGRKIALCQSYPVIGVGVATLLSRYLPAMVANYDEAISFKI